MRAFTVDRPFGVTMSVADRDGESTIVSTNDVDHMTRLARDA